MLKRLPNGSFIDPALVRAIDIAEPSQVYKILPRVIVICGPPVDRTRPAFSLFGSDSTGEITRILVWCKTMEDAQSVASSIHAVLFEDADSGVAYENYTVPAGVEDD